MGLPVIRDPASKWFVSPEELADSNYPDFISGGPNFTYDSWIQLQLSQVGSTFAVSGGLSFSYVR